MLFLWQRLSLNVGFRRFLGGTEHAAGCTRVPGVQGGAMSGAGRAETRSSRDSARVHQRGERKAVLLLSFPSRSAAVANEAAVRAAVPARNRCVRVSGEVSQRGSWFV